MHDAAPIGFQREVVTRRAELTFKHNVSQGRHGWLRLTPAYSLRVVDDIISGTQAPRTILDPFSGTGTTALCGTARGHHAIALDINPFLVWLTRAKVARYDRPSLNATENACSEIVRLLTAGECEPVQAPPISNVTRWWDPDTIGILCGLMGAIRVCSGRDSAVEDLLMIAFCRTMMTTSNAAFNHQSISFKKSRPASTRKGLFEDRVSLDVPTQFRADVAFVLAGAAQNPTGVAVVGEGDARFTAAHVQEKVDLLITSPPYPNRMSYIRELRPYMYWLGYLSTPREAGELDWRAIGGTWGAATSRVAAWEKDSDTYFPDYLPPLLDRIGSVSAKSGRVLASYVGKYFEDMWQHFRSAVRVVQPGGAMHYIVGNSKFYDVVVPTEVIYADMLSKAGASKIHTVALRKRNSKKELFEFDVVATV